MSISLLFILPDSSASSIPQKTGPPQNAGLKASCPAAPRLLLSLLVHLRRIMDHSGPAVLKLERYV